MEPLKPGIYDIKLAEITSEGMLRFEITQGKEHGRSVFVSPKIFNLASVDVEITSEGTVKNNVTKIEY